MLIYSLQSSQDLLQRSSYLNTADAEMGLLSAQAARIESVSSTAQKIGLFRRRERSFGSQLSCYYLLQTLRSYSKVMLSDTLPPFIHENCGGFGSRGLVPGWIPPPSPLLPAPLAICKSIMCMYFSKTSESTSFLWRTIEMELNRLDTAVCVFQAVLQLTQVRRQQLLISPNYITYYCPLTSWTNHQFHAFNEWTLMSTLQALTIYILLATLEEDNLSPSIDARMLNVMMVISLHSSWRTTANTNSGCRCKNRRAKLYVRHCTIWRVAGMGPPRIKRSVC